MKKVMKVVKRGLMAWFWSTIFIGAAIGMLIEFLVPGWVNKPEKLSVIARKLHLEKENVEKVEKKKMNKIGFIR